MFNTIPPILTELETKPLQLESRPYGVGYLAIPYSGKSQVQAENAQIQEYRWLIANHFYNRLFLEKVWTMNPIGMTHQMVTYPQNVVIPKVYNNWESYEEYDKALLRICQFLIVIKIDGWRESTGVQGEIKFADAEKIPVYEIEVGERIVLRRWYEGA